MDKSELRRIKLAERSALDSDQRSEWSEVMVHTLTQTFEYQQARMVHVFLSFGTEPHTQPLVNQCWMDDKVVVVPVVDTTSTEMLHAQLTRADALESGPFGISQPAHPRLISFDALNVSDTLVVVPLVAFNEQLYRIGYGKGYYDRFLHQRRFFAFGYAFSMGFAEDFQPDAHDESVDAIVTEQGIVRKRRSNSGSGFISLN